MREIESLVPVLAAVVMGFALVAVVLLSSDIAAAGEVKRPARELSCLTAVPSSELSDRLSSAHRPSVEPSPALRSGSVETCERTVELTRIRRKAQSHQRSLLDEGDQIAALESVQFALSNLGDGASYIWHRGNGRLSGVIRPTASFRDGAGKVCRHIVVKLMSGDFSLETETVACRRQSGVWELTG